MKQTARTAAVATLVAGSIIVLGMALWRMQLVLALLFSALIIAAAIRPGIEWLARHRIPRPLGVTIHYLLLLGVIALALSFVVPPALKQVNRALSPSGKAEIAQAASSSSGFKHEILTALQKRLKHLPTGTKLVKPLAQIGLTAFEVVIGIFFTFAAAAYWIFERDKTIDLVCSLFPRPKRKLIRDTWDLIDAKLGAFVRGELLLIVVVATVLSLAFWAIGEPYWILVGAFAGVVEIVPVIGPLTAGALAVAVGFTASVHVGVLAAVCVLIVRILEDYALIPKVLGEAVGLSPLLVLVSVTSVGILFSGWAVLFAVPLAAIVVTVFDVIVRNVDPAEQDVPAVIFSSGDTEG
jgi:predicted PurR-regulated permease PerM